MKNVRHALNLVGGLVLLPVAIVRVLMWPIVTCVVVGTVVHFVVKCW